MSHAQPMSQHMLCLLIPSTKKPRRTQWAEKLATQSALRTEQHWAAKVQNVRNFKSLKKIKAKQAKHVCKTSQVLLMHHIIRALWVPSLLMIRSCIGFGFPWHRFLQFSVCKCCSCKCLGLNGYGLGMSQLCYILFFLKLLSFFYAK